MAEISAISLPGWTGGLNKESDPIQVASNELIEALNVVIGLSGSISRRPGLELINNTSDGIIEEMWLWIDSQGDTWYLAMQEDSTFMRIATHDPGNTFVKSNSNWGAHQNVQEYPIGSASLAGKRFFSTRRSINSYYNDGTGFTLVNDNELDGDGSEFPNAAHLVSLHNRMFAFNCETSDGVWRNRMFYSAAGDPLTWLAEDYIDFDPDDGDWITAATQFGESIIVFKNRSMYVLSGVSEDTFTVFPLDSRVGTGAHRTVLPDGGVLRWFDPHTGVWSFDGQEFSKLDDKINTYLLEGINFDYAYKSIAFMWDQKYCLSVPWGDDTRNSRTFAYDTRLGSWVEWSFGIQGYWLDKQQQLYVGSPMVTGGEATKTVDRFGSSIASTEGSFVSRARTGWISPTQGARKHRLRRLDAAFTAQGEHTVTINMYRNFGLDVYQTHEVPTSPGGFIWNTSNWGEEMWGRGLDQLFARISGWGERWRWMSLEFLMDSDDETFQVNKLVLMVSDIGSLRGPGVDI